MKVIYKRYREVTHWSKVKQSYILFNLYHFPSSVIILIHANTAKTITGNTNSATNHCFIDCVSLYFTFFIQSLDDCRVVELPYIR